jgi:hypothetical protein
MSKDNRHPRNQGKIPVTRLASLKDFGGLLLGRDIAEIFKEGHVYEVREIMGEILVRDLGEHAICEYYEGNKVNFYVTHAAHCLTKQEYEKEKQMRDE